MNLLSCTVCTQCATCKRLPSHIANSVAVFIFPWSGNTNANLVLLMLHIAKDVARYVGSTQSGYRQGQSTTDVVWTQRWIAAKATRYNWECHMLGIDMSRAFDTIDRTKLLDVMALVTGPDEVRMIQHLLFHTQISVKVGKATANPFLSTIGTPREMA